MNDDILDVANYELASGSTILTLKNSYLNTLSEGTYKITFEYSNDSIDVALNVIDASGNDSGEADAKDTIYNVPDTGTNSGINDSQTSYDISNYVYTSVIVAICFVGVMVYAKRK